MTRTVDQVIEQHWPGRAVRISRLSGGMTNANFLADFGDEQVVVRIPGQDTGLLGIDRHHEAMANRLAASIGVAPEVLEESDTREFLITRFLPGRPVPADELSREPMLGEVARTLHQIHHAGTIPAVFNPYSVVHDYHEIALAKGVTESFDYDDVHALIERIDEARPFHPTAFCHNDLLNENFLFDERLRILDWEYAGMGDPFFDLANFSINHELDGAADEGLLTHYFGHCDEEETAALQLMKLVSELREAMWGVVQLAISSLDIDFVAYTQGRIDRFNSLYEEMDFAELLADVADPYR
jgi:thiamine kinase-like enzyme